MEKKVGKGEKKGEDLRKMTQRTCKMTAMTTTELKPGLSRNRWKPVGLQKKKEKREENKRKSM
jgi:hypothetical protein